MKLEFRRTRASGHHEAGGFRDGGRTRRRSRGRVPPLGAAKSLEDPAAAAQLERSASPDQDRTRVRESARARTARSVRQPARHRNAEQGVLRDRRVAGWRSCCTSGSASATGRSASAAVLCLVHDLCFTLGAIAVCHYFHDTRWRVSRHRGLQDRPGRGRRPAHAGRLLGERDHRELRPDPRSPRQEPARSPPQMINDSVNQTLSRTILAATTVFLVSVVLYWFGGEGVHLFAFVMVMGVLGGHVQFDLRRRPAAADLRRRRSRRGAPRGPRGRNREDRRRGRGRRLMAGKRNVGIPRVAEPRE